MDAVEFPYPVDVVVAPKLMGSEGFVRAGATVKELEPRDPDRVSVLMSRPIEHCASLISQKDGTSTAKALESASSDKITDTELCGPASQLPRFQGEDASEHLYGTNKNCVLPNHRPEAVQLQRKAGKVSRSGNGNLCSKRSRLAQLEDSMSLAGVDNKRDMSDKLTNSISQENTQLVKQKNNFNNKRGDKRGFKVPAKPNSFSMKVGLASFNSAAGGNNIFGVYGLKSDTPDLTKLMDDPPLKDLFDGTYECSSLVKDKGKKAANTDGDFIHSVIKAFSILQLPRPVQSQNVAEIDSFSNKKMSTCPLSSVSGVANGVYVDKGESCSTDISSCKKESCSKSESPTNPLDFPLYQPKDILERMALPPPKDLESLLLDAAKSSVSSRNTPDVRSGKQMSRRVNLPPFPWSHNSSGHYRTSSDAVKLSTSRSTCQGRWVRIGNVVSSLRIATDFLTNLESLTYDQSLVPSGLRIAGSENKISPSVSVSLPWFERDSSPSTMYSKTSSVNLESGGKVNYLGNAGHSPRLLAAAQTLYDIATQSLRQNPDGILKWPKKPSQKVMKARKLKSNEKLEEIFPTPIPGLASNNLLVRSVEIMPSKKPKLSMVENDKDLDRSNSLRKGPISWSTPRSSRSSPSKSIRDTNAETRHSTASTVKQSCMMPPPARVLDKACNSQQKVRKLLPMDWNRGRDRLD